MNERTTQMKMFIRTFGCQMNVHDSEQMAELMRREGYTLSADAAGADLIIINTCSVRAKPSAKVFSELGRYRTLKDDNPNLVIVVTGCTAQEYGELLLKRVDFLDIVLGTHNLHHLPRLVAAARARRMRSSCTEFHKEVASLEMLSAPPTGALSAFVTIMQGCDNFCSYCIVPHVRGREQSRPPEAIVAEIEQLAAAGIKEVTLLGQNVNSYGKDDKARNGFGELLRRVNAIEGIERIRFTTSHPKDLGEEMMRCFVDLEKLCEHIHLPFQSGSDRILKLMKRGYTREEYLQKVARLRSLCPDIAISADVIVGFPTESATDFADTLALMKDIEFDNLFSFKYSPRPFTAAQSLPDDVDKETKAERLSILQEQQAQQTLQNNKKREGHLEEVLVEGHSAKGDGLMGRTRGNRVVNFPGEATLIGKFVTVSIKTGLQNSLRGEIKW